MRDTMADFFNNLTSINWWIGVSEMGKMRQRWRRAWLRLVIISMVFSLLIVYLLVCDADKVYQVIAYAGAFIAGMVALSTYLKNSSIKRMEFIDQVYKEFDEDEEIDKLYDLLVGDKNLRIPLNSPNEKALTKALTLFDRILNYYEQNLINNETLSYIAAEILDFYNHSGVKDYIKDSDKKYEYDEKGYIEDIRFYSGLRGLGEICKEKFLTKEAKMGEFKKGDKVVLKSGGPTSPVTVENIGKNGVIHCVWFEGDTLKRVGFDPATLEKCPPKG